MPTRPAACSFFIFAAITYEIIESYYLTFQDFLENKTAYRQSYTYVPGLAYVAGTVLGRHIPTKSVVNRDQAACLIIRGHLLPIYEK